MKKNILLVLFLSCINLYAQQNNEILIPFLDGEKYGFADEQGKLVIPAKYDMAGAFFQNHELTMVVKDGKAMIINRKGKKILNGSTDYVRENEINSHEQIFNFKPEEITLDLYCQLDSCPNFAIYNKLNNNHLFDKIGNLYFVRSQGKVFLIDDKGNQKTKSYDRIRHLIYGEIEFAITEDSTAKKSGLLNEKGEQLLECAYDRVFYKGKGLFELSQNGKQYPYKSKYNENYLPSELSKKYQDKNRIITKKDGRFGLIDSLSNVLIPFEYDKLYPMGDDNYLYWNINKAGILSASKGIIYTSNQSAQTSEIDKERKFIPFVPYTETLAFINNGTTWDLVNINGEIEIKGMDGFYIDFQKVAQHIAAICKNGKIGINQGANPIFKPEYDQIFCIADNQTYIVKANNSWRWIDSKGSKIFEDFDEYKYVLRDYMYVKKNNRWFFVNSKGKAFIN